MSRYAWFVAAAATLAGCAAEPRTLYTWGSYEELIYGSYASPGKVAPEQRVEIREKDYQVARAANKRMPPGWHAHLGYLYYQLGKPDQARQELLTEEAEFPESAVFMDRLLANLRAKVNLIPWNPGDLPYEKPEAKRVAEFRTILTDRDVPAFVRASRGQDVMAACGQLALLESAASSAVQISPAL